MRSERGPGCFRKELNDFLKRCSGTARLGAPTAKVAEVDAGAGQVDPVLDHVRMGGHQFPLQFLCIVIGGDRLVIVLLGFEKIGQLLEARTQAFAVEGAVWM